MKSAAECRAVCVDPRRVHEIWPAVEDRIRRAMERLGFSDYRELERKVRRGSALLWLAWDGSTVQAAAVTELHVANGRKYCTIVACGGRHMKRWLSLLGVLETFAKAEGCSATLVIGRPGWRRVLAGYRHDKHRSRKGSALMGGTSSKETTQKSQTEPWAEAKPVLTGILGQLGNQLGNIGPSATENSGVSDPDAKRAGGKSVLSAHREARDGLFFRRSGPHRHGVGGLSTTTSTP